MIEIPEDTTTLALGALPRNTDVAALAAALRRARHLEQLSFELSDWRQPGGLEIVRGLASLRDLRICPLRQGEDLSALASCPRLRVVRLTGLQGVDVSPLAALTELEELFLSGPAKNLKALAPLGHLVRLGVQFNPRVSLEAFGGAKSLSVLELVGSKVTDWSELQVFKLLRRLNIGNTNLRALAELPALNELEHLDISHCRSLKSLEGIERLKGLKTLYMWDLKTVPSLAPIKALNALKEIILRGTRILDADLSFLPKLRTLESVVLTYDERYKAQEIATRMPWAEFQIQGSRVPAVEVHRGIPLLSDHGGAEPIYRIELDITENLGVETNDEAEERIDRALKKRAPQLHKEIDFDSEGERFVARSRSLPALRAVAETIRAAGEEKSQRKK